MKTRTKWIMISIVSAVLGAALGAVIWRQIPETRAFYTDADTIHAPRAEARVRDILWQPPVKLSEIVNTADEDYEPRISWNGMTLFFVRGKAGENSDIYISQRMHDGWTEPAPLSAVNSEYEDLGPEPTADGAALYFYSDRPGGQGGYDIWVSRRGDDGWLPPTNLGPAVNSEFNDYGPALTPDARTLYYASNRPAPADQDGPEPEAWPATVREDLFRRTYDLYAATVSPGGFAAARPLSELNTPHNEGAPCVSPAGDFIYFSTDRPGGLGGFDIYRARITPDAYEAPTNLGPTLNTFANELDPGLTHLGYALYFSSDRPGDEVEASSRRDYNLYYTSSREVFLDVVSTARPPIDWAALLRGNLTNLIWLLLGLLALLLMWAFASSIRDGKLGLLARCLLASLLLHMLLMFCFSFWQVSSSVISAFRQRGEIQIALASPRHGDELAAQIRGELTDVASPGAASFELVRRKTPLENALHDASAELAAVVNRLEFTQTPTVALDAREARRPERDAAPPESKIELEHTPAAAARSLALKLPADSRRLREAEFEPIVEAVTDADAPVTRPVVQFPTSQPARYANQNTLTPDRRLAGDVMGNESLSRDYIAADSRPRDTTLLLATTDMPAPPPELAVALPSETDRAEAVEETAPRVAAREVETHRAPTSPECSSHDEPTRQVSLPASAADLTSEAFSLAASVEFGAKDADARTASFESPASGVEASPSSPPLELKLPSLEEVTSDQRAESGPTVATAPSAPSRPNADNYAVDDADAAWDSFVRLSPTAPERPVSTPVRFSHAPIPNHDAAPHASEHHPTPAMTIGDRRDPLALHLELPEETEPPPAFEVTGLATASLQGRVFDADTRAPLAGATIRLDLPNIEPLTATTDDQGRYALAVPPVPDHFALSASLDDYIPSSIDVPSSELNDGVLVRDFALAPVRDDIVAVEIEPEVHHLGNDRWNGVINSQFQKDSEGRRFNATFELTADQISPPPRRPAVKLLAKGVQCPHQIFINGWRLRQRLDRSPRDGGFGEFTARFDPDMLVEGVNTIEIRGVSCRGDIDDFEFVNIRIELAN